MTAVDDEQPVILLERRGPLGVLTLNRPHRANAINAALLRELRTATVRIEQDPGIRAVIVTGSGRHFCGGVDVQHGPVRRRAVFERHPRVLDLGRLPQPVIAAINGAALGGGCEIALSCDFRYMAGDATIGLPAIRAGALPGSGTMARLSGLVGVSWAKRMIMTGDPVDAERAERIGLVDEVVDPGTALAAAEQFALRLTERADYALRAAKALLCRRRWPAPADLRRAGEPTRGESGSP